MENSETNSSLKDRYSTDEAFAVLANPTRLAILQAMWDDPDEKVTFSDLRTRVRVVDSGNFNYHLKRLTDHFIRRTDSGYQLRGPGKRLVRAVVAGAVEESPAFDPVKVDDECPFCDGTVELQYTDGYLIARCLVCDGSVGPEAGAPTGTYLQFECPPTCFRHRSPDEILLAAYTFYAFRTLPMMANVCLECAGTVDVSSEICDAHDASDGQTCKNCGRLYRSLSEYTCTHCHYSRTVPMRCRLFADPVVLSFFCRPSSIPEYRSLSDWMTKFMSSKYISERVVSEDPLRVQMIARVAGDELRVTLDECAAIIDMHRS